MAKTMSKKRLSVGRALAAGPLRDTTEKGAHIDYPVFDTGGRVGTPSPSSNVCS
jgi:hypothetical protein